MCEISPFAVMDISKLSESECSDDGGVADDDVFRSEPFLGGSFPPAWETGVGDDVMPVSASVVSTMGLRIDCSAGLSGDANGCADGGVPPNHDWNVRANGSGLGCVSGCPHGGVDAGDDSSVSILGGPCPDSATGCAHGGVDGSDN